MVIYKPINVGCFITRTFAQVLEVVPSDYESFFLSHLMLSICAEGSLKAAFASSNALCATSGVHSCSNVQKCARSNILHEKHNNDNTQCAMCFPGKLVLGARRFSGGWAQCWAQCTHQCCAQSQCTHQPSGPETLSLLEENTALLGENIFFTGFHKEGASARQETLVH